MKIRWQKGPRHDNVTVIMLARNLVALHYPFVEAILSAVPLGCRFLIGDAHSTDSTHQMFSRLSAFIPMDIVQIPWRPETGGTAIGLATQEIIKRCKTPRLLNLQACEILADDAVEGIKTHDKTDHMVFRFRHIWGGFNFDGGQQGHGYGVAPRFFPTSVNLGTGDGCWPRDWSEGWQFGGTIFRYAYTFKNQAEAKATNYHLYRGDAQQPHHRLESIEWCRRNPNFNGPHPAIVQHLIGAENYDTNASMKRALEWLS